MPAPQPAPTGATTNGFDAGHAHAILRELMDAGAELVRDLVRQNRAEPAPHPFWGEKAPVEHPTEHIARCYDRITRSVRRSIALARHLDDPVRARPTPAPAPAEPRRPAPAEPLSPANDARPEPGTEAERPDEPDWDEDGHQDLARPLGEVLAELGSNLGLLPSQPAPNGPPEPGPAPRTAPRTAPRQASHPAPVSPAEHPARPKPFTNRSPIRKRSG